MQVYADNAATTKMSQTSIDAMLPYMTTVYGNPSSLHSVGQRAKEALDAARETVAQCLGCEPREIIFTSGGSEADNQAIISAARLGEKKGKKHIISTAFEHHAVLHTLKKLEKEGFEIELLDVHQGHNITAQQVKDAIRPDTCLVTTMYANKEIGSILPIAEIGAICKKYGLLLIEDAAQGTGASYKGKKCGSFGDIATTSFFPSKPLGCYGDGGAVFTDDDGIAELLRSYKVHGKGPKGKYDNVRIGLNSRLDTLQAGVMLPKLAVLDQEIAMRQEIAERYHDAFAGKLQLPVITDGCVSAYAQYCMLAKDETQRQNILDAMAAANIPSLIYYPTPLHVLDAFAPYPAEELPNAAHYARCNFGVPFSPYLTREDQDAVIRTVLEEL